MPVESLGRYRRCPDRPPAVRRDPAPSATAASLASHRAPAMLPVPGAGQSFAGEAAWQVARSGGEIGMYGRWLAVPFQSMTGVSHQTSVPAPPFSWAQGVVAAGCRAAPLPLREGCLVRA